ncbi:MAG: DNA-binding response regulator [Flavobacteriaceae bacterium]|nr:MAG: DNA-binding response regulator [Flavobacteriaceae bacterium]
MEKKIQLFIVDDHAMVRDGLKLNLQDHPDIQVIGEASNGEEALAFLEQNPQVDVVLMDITMPVLNGLDACQKIKKNYPKVNCLMLSMHDDAQYILESIEKGAMGYLLKESESEEIYKAIQTVYQGKRYYSTPVSNTMAENYLMTKTQKPEVSQNVLSKRETEILGLINQGLTNKEISLDKNLSIRTIEVHRFNMMKKLQAANIVDLLKKARDLGIIG